MSEASFASLSPILLARKGGAKPAMRPQLGPLPKDLTQESLTEALEDLGWNDMGGEDDTTDGEGAKVVALPLDKVPDITKSKKSRTAGNNLTSMKSKAASKNSHRVAFTLRLNRERHLKLKLAATLEGTSAQALVTQALDAKFAQIEDLEALFGRINRD